MYFSDKFQEEACISFHGNHLNSDQLFSDPMLGLGYGAKRPSPDHLLQLVVVRDLLPAPWYCLLAAQGFLRFNCIPEDSLVIQSRLRSRRQTYHLSNSIY